MSRELVVRRLAEAELAEAIAWYELQSPGLGKQFLDQFHRSAREIEESPLRWPVYHRDVRRYVISRFPYLIYYDVRPTKIRILRVVHGARDPEAIRQSLE